MKMMKKCPICNNEILEGYIETPAIEWIPKEGKAKLVYSKDNADGFRLGKHCFGNMKKQTSYFCKNCNKIIIDCDL